MANFTRHHSGQYGGEELQARIESLANELDEDLGSINEARAVSGSILRAIDGIAIIESGDSFTLPGTYETAIHAKNATGGSVTIAVPSGSTMYGSAAGQTSITLLDGEAAKFAKKGTVWHVL